MTSRKKNVAQQERVDIPSLDAKVKSVLKERLELMSKKEEEIERIDFIYFNSQNKEEQKLAKEKSFALRKEIENDSAMTDFIEYNSLAGPLLKKYEESLLQKKKVFFCTPKTQQQQPNTGNELLKKFIDIARNYIDIEDGIVRVSFCENCGLDSSHLVEKDEKVYCGGCGKLGIILEDSAPYKDMQRVSGSSRFVYMTKGHFLEAMEKFQAKKNTKIPEIVMEAVRGDLKKYGIDLKTAMKKHVYMILVDNNMTDYYEELSLIMYKLNGTKPPDISKHQEKLSELYDVYEKTYAQIKDKSRRKSLNVWYILLKLLQSVGYIHNPDDFCFLKNTPRTRDCDDKFAEVCGKLGWNFEYTI